MSEHTHSMEPAVEDNFIRILVVDDQPVIAESIRQLLVSEIDIEVHTCQDPTLALSVAADVLPSVILQDLVMPEVEGMLLIKFFRAHPTTKATPIVVLSSKEEPTTKAMAFGVGANDYLVKLPDPVELIARLRYHATAYHNFLRQDEASQTLAYNKTLEATVKSRTAELEAALNTLKRAQAQLVHTERMNSMSQLVAGIAHEVNNPINFIYGNLNYAKSYVQDLLDLVETYQECYPSPDPSIREKLDALDLEFSAPDLLKSFVSLRSGAKRIQNLVLSLRNFSRFDEADVKIVDVHEGLESTLAMLAADLEEITVQKHYGDLPPVECFASQLNQVFMHIIRNAIDALTQRKEESLPGSEYPDSAASDESTVDDKLLVPTLKISTTVRDEESIIIWIADSGPGIPPEVKARMFDPFFTTKAVGKGTGLGLAISDQIVTAQHGGQLTCYSMPGKGAKFAIELPIALSRFAEPTDEEEDEAVHCVSA